MTITPRTIFRYLPLVGTSMIILAVLKLSLYYSFFHIPILVYLDLSECIFLFLDGFMVWTLIACIGLLIIYQSVIIIVEKEFYNEKKKLDGLQPSEAESHRTRAYKRSKRRFRIIIVLCIAIVLFYAFFLRKDMTLPIVLFFLPNLILLLFMFEVSSLMDKTLALFSITDGRFKTLSIFVLSYVLLVYNISLAQAFTVKYETSNKFSAIMKSGSEVVTSDSLIYVGRTKNYVFFYDRKLNQSNIYRSDDIKLIKY